MSKINQSKYTIKIDHSFEDELKEHWQAIYELGANYNVHFDWCKIWTKHFGQDLNIHIISIWEEENCVLVAPFYLKKKRLYLIGSNPTLFDEFDILYRDAKYFEPLFDYLASENFEINFSWLNAETAFAKYMVRRFYAKAIVQFSSILETNPFWEGAYLASKNLRNDVKKRKKRSIKTFGEELVFEYQSPKDIKQLEDFISQYKKRYKAHGLFNKQVEIDFVKELFLETDLVVLSRLYWPSSKKTLAFHFSYLDTNNKFWSSMASYDLDYIELSPGKVLLYDLMNHVSEMGIHHFSFGRGSEAYKRHCTNNESILFETISFHNSKKIAKVKRVSNRILNSLV